MLDLLFYDKDVTDLEEAFEDGVTVSFTTDGFKLLIESGFFELSDGEELPLGGDGVDLTLYRESALAIVVRYPIEHTRLELIAAVQKFDCVTGDI